MRKLFDTSLTTLWPALGHVCLLLLRVAIGAMMLTHGLPKLGKLLAGNYQFADPFGLGPALSLLLAVFAEFFCSVLLLLGLGTRLAAIPLIVTMLVAALVQHAADPFEVKEKAVLYLLVYLTLLVFGSGKYSLDHLLSKRSS